MTYKKRSMIPCHKNLYFSLIYFCIIYGIKIFGSLNKSVLSSLIISCNHVLRALQGKLRHYPVNLLYSNFNTLPVHDQFTVSLLTLVYRCTYIKFSIPPVVYSMFILHNIIHNHSTRSHNLFALNHNFSSSAGSNIYLAPSL